MNNKIDLKDLRNANKVPVKGKTIIASGIELNENNVKVMLTTMGVNPTPEIIQEAIGFMSANGTEINMSNLAEFLKSKNIISNISVTDLRSKKN